MVVNDAFCAPQHFVTVILPLVFLLSPYFRKNTVHLARALHFFLLDVTPPSVQNCPQSITDTTNVLQKTMTWTAPTFTDNVGVISVLSNRNPGFTMDAYTSLTIQYEALDAAGNVVYCTFNVTLEGITMPGNRQ